VTLGHGEYASSMQRVPPDVHGEADGGGAAEGLRRDVSWGPQPKARVAGAGWSSSSIASTLFPLVRLTLGRLENPAGTG